MKISSKSQPREGTGDHNRFKSRQPVDWWPNYLYRTLLDFSSMWTKSDEHPNDDTKLDRENASHRKLGKYGKNRRKHWRRFMCLCVAHTEWSIQFTIIVITISFERGRLLFLSLPLFLSLIIFHLFLVPFSCSLLLFFIEQVYIVIIKSCVYPAVKRSTFSSDKQIWDTVLCAMHFECWRFHTITQIIMMSTYVFKENREQVSYF